MHKLEMAFDLLAYSSRQWAASPRIDAFQRARLRAVVAHAYATVPLYRERFDTAGIRPGDVHDIADLAGLPALRREELEAAAPAHKLSRAFNDVELHVSRTSGASGRPLTVHTDPAARRLKKAQFLRALGAGGYRLGHSLMVLTAGPPGGNPRWLRWNHVGRDAPPEKHLAAFLESRPRFVYGFVTPLRRLAELLLGERGVRPPVRAVFSSGETLDAASRTVIEAGFGVPMFDVWGAAEVGTIGYECAAHDGMHVAEDVVALELLPLPGGEARKVVLTSLKAYAVPLIRYEIGDLAAWASPTPCPCGRTLRRITRLQGRVIDCLRRPDGVLVPPYPIEAAIEKVPGIRRFQVAQSSPGSVVTRVVGPVDAALVAGIRDALLPLLGPEIQVEVDGVDDLEPPPGQKFRLISCRIASADERPERS